MDLSREAILLLAELARRRPAALVADPTVSAAAAENLRGWMYPKQRAFFTSPAKWRATKKTRRMGATAGGCTELLARAITIPGFRATYVTTTADEARDRAWLNDSKTGLLDLLREHGEQVKHPTLECIKFGGVIIEVRNGDLSLEFANGSQIEMFGADNIRRHRTKRGNAKHVFWIDEAQDFPFIEEFFDAVVIGSLTDTDGECWMTGTPGRDCAGMFYEITKEASVGDERMFGWEVHEISVTDNPFFGTVVQSDTDWWVDDNRSVRHGPYDTRADAEAAALEIRWSVTGGAAKIAKGWKGDEPDFIREWLGKWVKADARYVYPVHGVPRHQLLYAPQRQIDNPFVGSHQRFDGHPPWYDHHLAVRDLPRIGLDRRPHKWLYSLWFDFGFNPDPFACVMWAFTPTLKHVYEMFSWKMTGVHSDDQARYIKMAWDVEPAIVSFGGDAAGKQADFAEWSRRLNLPLEEANKQGKNTLEELLAGDIRRGLVHLRDGSPLYEEMKHLVYLPGKPGKTREVNKHRKVGGVIPGDHCCDAARYGFSALTHYLSKVAGEGPPKGSREALLEEGENEERSIERMEAIRDARMDEADESAMIYGRYGYDD